MAIFGARKSASGAETLRIEGKKPSAMILRALGLMTSAMLVMTGAIVGGTAAHAEDSSVTIIDPETLPEGWELHGQTSVSGKAWFFRRSAPYEPLSPGEVLTVSTTAYNTGTVAIPSVSFAAELAETLDQATFIEGSFATTDASWTMGEVDQNSEVTFTGPLPVKHAVYMTYQVRVKNLADFPPSASYVISSEARALGDASGTCGGECWAEAPIWQTMSITPETANKVYSDTVTYATVLSDPWNQTKVVTGDTSFTSEAGPMVDNVLTVKQVGSGMRTVGTFGEYTATATVTGTASPVPAVTIDPSNGTTISGTGVTGNTVVVTLPSGAEQTVVVVDGKWSITPSETLEDGDVVTVAQKDKNTGILSPDATETIEKGTPAAPAVNLSNGKTITGGPVSSSSTLEFKDADQNPIPGTVVIDPETGLFTFTPATPITDDSAVVDVVVTSRSGNSSDPTRVEFVTTVPSAPSLEVSDGATITGGPISKKDTVTVVDGDNNPIKGSLDVAEDGTFTFTPDVPLSEGDVAKVIVTGPSGLTSTPKGVELVTVAPSAPEVNVSNGKTVTGGPIAEGDTVSVVDGKGDKIKGSVSVDPEGNFTFTPDVPLSDDDVARVVVTGPSGLKSTPEDVTIVTKAPAVPTVKPSDGVTITGGPVGKKDTVTVVDGDGNDIKGTVTVDDEGNFTFTPDVPLSEGDTAKIVVTGPSGLETETGEVEIISTAPAAPSIDISNGKTITGGPIADRDEVTVVDDNGNPIKGTVTVEEDGMFTFTPDVPLTDDDFANVVVTGPSGLTSTPKAVELVTITPAAPAVDVSNGKTITGGPIGDRDEVTVVDGEGNKIKGSVSVDPEGNFTFTPDVPLSEDDVAKVVVTGPSGLKSTPEEVIVVTKAPAVPTVKPSDGVTITGGPVGKNDVVTVVDGDNNPIAGKVEVDQDGNFTFTPDVPLTDEDTAKVVVTGPSGLKTESDEVDLVTTAPVAPTVKPSDGVTIKGGPVGDRDEVTVLDGKGDKIKGKVEVDKDGNFTFTPDVPLTDEDAAQVIVTGPSGLTTAPVDVDLITTAPAVPVVKPSDGVTIAGGKIAEGNTVSVVDGDNNPIPGKVVVDPEGNFVFTPDVPLTEEDIAKVVVTGPSGLETKTGEIEIITTVPAAPAVKPSDGITITGGQIGENDTVTVVDGDNNPIPGKVEVDKDGNFTFTPDTPLTEEDSAKVVITGPSGLVTDGGDVEIITTAPIAPVVKPSDGVTIKGGPVGDRDEVTVLDNKGDKIKGTVEVDKDGNFTFTPDVPLTDEDSARVVITGPSGLESAPSDVEFVTQAPVAPIVKPSDGNTIKGGPIGKEDTVTVVDRDGNPIKGEVEVDDEGNFTFTPDVPLSDEDSAKVIVTGPSGLETETGEIDIVTTPPTAPTVKPSDGNTIKGGPIGKDDTVTVFDGNDNPIKGKVEVDDEGNFTFTPDVPLSDEDSARVVITGPSGLESDSSDVDLVTKAPVAPTVKPSDGNTIKGGPIGKDDTVTVWDDKGSEIKGSLEVDDEGNFTFTPDVPLTEEDNVKVVVTGPSGLETETGGVEVVTTAPAAPAVNPSNGTSITGGPIGQGDTVTVLDGNGDKVKGETVVDKDGNFTFTPDTPLTEEESARVIITGPSGLVSDPTDVEFDFVAPDAPVVNPSAGATVTGTTEPGATVKVYDSEHKLVGQGIAGEDGSFKISFNPALADEGTFTVTATDLAGNESDGTTLIIDATVPTAPSVDPSDGKTVTGCAAPGSTVTVFDKDGIVIGTAIAGDDCSYTVTLSPEQKPGSKITVQVTSPSGVESDTTGLSVGAISMQLEAATVALGASQVAYGYGFQPGELVTGVMHSTPFDLGSQLANDNGEVTFEFTVPADVELGTHSVTLTGAFSGKVSQEFQVTAAAGDNSGAGVGFLSTTGFDGMLPLAAGALLAMIGAGLVLVVRKRRGVHAAE